MSEEESPRVIDSESATSSGGRRAENATSSTDGWRSTSNDASSTANRNVNDQVNVGWSGRPPLNEESAVTLTTSWGSAVRTTGPADYLVRQSLTPEVYREARASAPFRLCRICSGFLYKIRGVDDDEAPLCQGHVPEVNDGDSDDDEVDSTCSDGPRQYDHYYGKCECCNVLLKKSWVKNHSITSGLCRGCGFNYATGSDSD